MSHREHWTDDPRELLAAGPDFDLAAMDRRGKPGFEGGKSDGRAFLDERGELLSELQERLYAHGRAGGERALLIVVQGLDTAGKGGVARHVMSRIDPQGVALRAFGAPTKEEADHHYLWRIKKALPGPGMIGVFDRSHYEDVLIVRVDDLVPQDVWEPRYEEINAFERSLVESGTVVLKFALMVSHDEQGVRLMERLDRRDKHWKFTENDLTTRAKWDDYQAAYADVFAHTSTEHAPWYVIPADRKWYSRAAIIEIITQTLVDLDLGWPDVDWDPAQMRERLAEQMSSAALKTSLAETADNVRSALADDREVGLRSIEVSLGADPAQDTVQEAQVRAARAQIEADKAGYLAELAATRLQKEELVERAKARETLAQESDSEPE